MSFKRLAFSQKHMSYNKNDPSSQLGQFEKIGILVVNVCKLEENAFEMHKHKFYSNIISTYFLKFNVFIIYICFRNQKKGNELL